jgi:hypothetical protein
VTALITARQHINMVHRTHYPLTGLLVTIFLPPKRLHKAHKNVKTCYFEIRLSDAPFEVVDCRRQECTFTCELNYISQFLFAQRWERTRTRNQTFLQIIMGAMGTPPFVAGLISRTWNFNAVLFVFNCMIWRTYSNFAKKALSNLMKVCVQYHSSISAYYT